jgi:hypothetical protein
MQDLAFLWRVMHPKYKNFTYFSLAHEAKCLLGLEQATKQGAHHPGKYNHIYNTNTNTNTYTNRYRYIEYIRKSYITFDLILLFLLFVDICSYRCYSFYSFI